MISIRQLIASHANEIGTIGGKVRAGSKTEAFLKAVKWAQVHVPLSGKTMEFDAGAEVHHGMLSGRVMILTASNTGGSRIQTVGRSYEKSSGSVRS